MWEFACGVLVGYLATRAVGYVASKVAGYSSK